MKEIFIAYCFPSNSAKRKLKKHKDICVNHDYRYVEMPKEDNKIQPWRYFCENSIHYLR